jgi:D-2-hydroxyacid dehydrogenase (NADP+)
MIVSLLHWENEYISSMEAFLGEKITICRNGEEARRILPEAEIVITVGGAPLFDGALLSLSSRLRLVLSISAGVDQLPILALHERGVAICNTKGAQAASMAEHVICGMLAISHRFPAFIRNQEKKCWKNYYGKDIAGQTVCIIGTGSIGAEIGKRAKAFDMRVYGVKRNPEPIEYFDNVCGTDMLHEALRPADFIVMATPLTSATYHLLKAANFQVMKKTAVVVNVSRGQTIDERALIDALQNGQISGAVLDVFENEPLPPDHSLWQMDNVLITPHNAALTYNTNRKIIEILCENIRRFRQGQALLNEIKPEISYLG